MSGDRRATWVHCREREKSSGTQVTDLMLISFSILLIMIKIPRFVQRVVENSTVSTCRFTNVS